MKKIKWKTLLITSLVCLAPILLGLAMYNQLPEQMPIHFDINNNPDNFASKEFTVFALPLILLVFHIFGCAVVDIYDAKSGKSEKLTSISKWILPAVSLVIYPTTIFYPLNNDLDIRRIAVFIVGILFIVLGNYMPKSNYIQIMGKMKEVTGDRARKFLRYMSYMMVIHGLIFLFTLFFPPIASIIALILLIPFTVLSIIFGIKISKNQ